MATSKKGDATPTQKESQLENIDPIQALQDFPPLIDLGKLGKKKSRKLRKGKDISGISEIHSAVAQVMSKIEAENAIPVIISYEEKPKRRKKVKKLKVNGWELNVKKVKKRLKKNGLSHPWL